MLWSRNGLNVSRKNELLVQKVFFSPLSKHQLVTSNSFLVIAGKYEKIVTYVRNLVKLSLSDG